MTQLSTFIRFVLGGLALAFLALIVFVSVLGENHRVDFLVEGFFKDLGEGNYSRICPFVRTDASDDSACADRLFLLETALLSHFNLLDQKDYSLVIFRDRFWVPFASPDHVDVDVALTEKKSNMFERWMARFEVKERVDGFMTLERHNGQWKIASVRFNTPPLAQIMDDYANRLDLNRYIVKTANGYAFQPGEIDFSKLSPADRRLFEYSLKKISDF